MADKVIIELPGKLTLEVDERGEVTGEETESLTPVAGHGLMSAGLPPDDVFRRRQYRPFYFYDLGTRWNGVEYQYKYFSQPVSPFTDFSAFFLEDNPFDTTDGQPNCLPLPFRAEWLYLDATLKKEGEESKKYVCGQNNRRPFLTDLVGGIPVDDPRSAWKSPGVLHLPPGVGKEWQLQIQSGLYYGGFDTSDVDRPGLGGRYKVTLEPSRVAEAVAFRMPTLEKKRVYLMPTCVTRWLFNANLKRAECFGARRFPVLPGFELQATPLVPKRSQGNTQGGIGVYSSPGLRAGLIGLYTGMDFTFIEPPAPGDEPFSLDTATRVEAETPFGFTLLAAVIVVGKKTYYVWHKNQSGFPSEVELIGV